MPKRKCKHCKEYTEEFVTVPRGTFCTMDHAVLWANAEQVKQRDRQLRKLKADNNKVKKATRAKHRADKERVKTRGQWTKEAQAEFNKFIRLRDKDEPCISCQRFHTGQYHAGHYRSVGAHPELRFNELNNHKQCAPCNNHLSGNLVDYRINLIKKIGLEKVEWLEGPHKQEKLCIDEIKITKNKYKEKCHVCTSES